MPISVDECQWADQPVLGEAAGGEAPSMSLALTRRAVEMNLSAVLQDLHAEVAVHRLRPDNFLLHGTY